MFLVLAPSEKTPPQLTIAVNMCQSYGLLLLFILSKYQLDWFAKIQVELSGEIIQKNPARQPQYTQ